MHVRVVPYRPEWPLLFAQEAEKIGKAFGAELLAVHHIGSTSVEGLAAKPIIDILAVVRDVNAIDTFAPAMEALGYEAMGEFGIPGRRYYRKGGENRTHQIHAFSEEDHWNIDRHLAVDVPMVILSAVLRGAGSMIVPMAASLLSLWLARVPIAYWIAGAWGKEFIYYSYPISWAIGILIVLVAYLHGGWKKKAIVAPTNREEQPADHLSPFAN